MQITIAINVAAPPKALPQQEGSEQPAFTFTDGEPFEFTDGASYQFTDQGDK